MYFTHPTVPTACNIAANTTTSDMNSTPTVYIVTQEAFAMQNFPREQEVPPGLPNRSATVTKKNTVISSIMVDHATKTPLVSFSPLWLRGVFTRF